MKIENVTKQSLSHWATLYLRIVLPITVICSVALLIFCLQEMGRDPVMAKHFYRPLVEYPLAALTIAAGGGVLIDYIERNEG